MALVVAISEKLVQETPWQRSMRYRVTPVLSLAAPQERSIWLALTGVALKVPGALGG